MKPIVWSYSFLSSYKNCPHQCYRRYVVRDVPYVESPEQKWGNDVHTAMELRVGKQEPLPFGMEYFECFAIPFDNFTAGAEKLTEIKLGVTIDGKSCDFFAENVWGRGKVDAIVFNPPHAAIYDWKTGKRSKWSEDPFELRIEALLLQAKHPTITKIQGAYVWLKDNKLGKTEDLSNTSQTWAEVSATMAEVNERLEANNWFKNEGPLCAYCNVLDCEFNRSQKK